jgi:hypothetical protein|nr:MAG TPA: hypothetical protein [Caudoviricetes sp.]
MDEKEIYKIQKEAMLKARKDLRTGISQQTLDKMLEKGFIDGKNYIEIKNNIEMLNYLADTNELIIELEKNLTSEEIFEIESQIVAKFLGCSNCHDWIEIFFQANPKLDIDKSLPDFELTDKIAKLCNYENWKHFLENYPYPIPEENKIFETMVE